MCYHVDAKDTEVNKIALLSCGLHFNVKESAQGFLEKPNLDHFPLLALNSSF